MSDPIPLPECYCACHTMRGNHAHIVPCCDRPPLNSLQEAYRLTWNEYSGPFFDHYEIQRSARSMLWEVLTLVPEAHQVGIIDWLPPAGQAVSYRIRSVLTDGRAGQWVILQPELVTA